MYRLIVVVDGISIIISTPAVPTPSQIEKNLSYFIKYYQTNWFLMYKIILIRYLKYLSRYYFNIYLL